jgi:hypothetical protein
MYETYAILENGQIVAYPVNPRVWLAMQNCYNVPEYWDGGVLDGKTYVYCHNFAPTPPYNKNLQEVMPTQNPDNGLWYRQYTFVDATPEEISHRTADAIEGVNNGISVLLQMVDERQAEINLMSVEKQTEWALYKEQVLALKNISDFPWGVVWPNMPDDGNQLNIGVERL